MLLLLSPSSPWKDTESKEKWKLGAGRGGRGTVFSSRWHPSIQNSFSHELPSLPGRLGKYTLLWETSSNSFLRLQCQELGLKAAPEKPFISLHSPLHHLLYLEDLPTLPDPRMNLWRAPISLGCFTKPTSFVVKSEAWRQKLCKYSSAIPQQPPGGPRSGALGLLGGWG